MTKTGWDEFTLRAKNSLQQLNRPEFKESFIEFLYEPSFSPVTFLQLTWTSDNAKFNFSTWDKRTDQNKFFDPLENIKYLGKVIQPTIVVNSGALSFNKLRPTINFISQINIKPRLNKQNSITVDGSYYSLTIGTGDTRTMCQWHTIPDEWKQLEKLTEMLLILQKDLA